MSRLSPEELAMERRMWEGEMREMTAAEIDAANAAADAEVLSWGSAEGWYCEACARLWGFGKVSWGECPGCGAKCALRFDDGECLVTDLVTRDGAVVAVQTDVCDA